MTGPRLRLVKSPGGEAQHSEAIAAAGAMLARRDAVMTLTVTDPLGNECFPRTPEWSMTGLYEVRATAYFRGRDLPSVTGRSQPVDGYTFVAEASAPLKAHTEAVLALIEQLRPHPSEWPS